MAATSSLAVCCKKYCNDSGHFSFFLFFILSYCVYCNGGLNSFEVTWDSLSPISLMPIIMKFKMNQVLVSHAFMLPHKCQPTYMLTLSSKPDFPGFWHLILKYQCSSFSRCWGVWEKHNSETDEVSHRCFFFF